MGGEPWQETRVGGEGEWGLGIYSSGFLLTGFPPAAVSLT